MLTLKLSFTLVLSLTHHLQPILLNMSPDFDYEARLPLIQRLDVTIKGLPVSIDYWAMVWMSELESLRARVEQLEQSPELRLREVAVLGDTEFSTINRCVIAPCKLHHLLASYSG